MAENPSTETLVEPGGSSTAQQRYSGNDYDVYALVAGTLGGSSLLMCVSFNTALYCLPVIPLILGIIALRKASQSVDPNRTRKLAWLGIAGGGLGTLFVLVLIAIFVLYFAFIFAVIASSIQSGSR
ncbi:MAG: hypothetical protein KGJ80_04210 [Chloroflexota bacterium]|nr:hypothetical protein [Chloroflexota bacterium]